MVIRQDPFPKVHYGSGGNVSAVGKIRAMGFEDYWYIIAESGELTANRVLARCVLDQTVACFRAADGAPVVLHDRCLHRNAPLSAGSVRDGLLSCPYR